jgi:hypothetical protein
MRNPSLVLLQTLIAFTLLISAGFVRADQVSSVQTKKVTTTEETVVPSTAGAPDLINAPAAPAIRWREFSGNVTHVNIERQIMEIRLNGSHEYIGIPVDGKTVGIYKNKDHQYALTDIRPGDQVTVRNLTYNF